MAYEYPDDGHIYVCVRVRDVATVSGMGVNNNTHRSTRENIKEAQRICVSTMENVVILHDPRAMDDASCVARDADSVVQLLTARSTGLNDKHRARKLLTSTATANYFEYDRCLNSMDADSMLEMPLIQNSDFIRPPEYGTQEDVYICTAIHAVSAAVEGINSCVFAYGQTGSGKTFTLFGDTTCIRRDPGVVPRTIDDLFQRLEAIKREYNSNSETEYTYRVQLSFFEIYQNEVYCLFSRKGPLRVNFSRDNTGKEEMIIHDLQHHIVLSSDKAYPLVEMGLRRRQTGETGMNARSSRSHAILQLRVTQWRTNRITKESVELNATINLVDLAGSERQKTAKTDGKSRDEGIQINQSLATLARVINEISRGAKYVNYRDSLLTMVLKDNLGGNSKTFMIATIAPVSFCYQESCATLQYAKDVRKIRNRPTVNKTFQTRSNLLDLNARLKQENERLKHHIDGLLKGINASGVDLDNAEAAVEWLQNGKETGKALGCSALSKTLSTTETVITAPTIGTAPLVVTAHRKYTNLDGIGVSCVEGRKIGITSLTKDVVQFSLTDMLKKAKQTEKKELEKSNNNKDDNNNFNDVQKDYGMLEFERVSQRSCEQHYWMRYIPGESSMGCNVDCQINGFSITNGDRRQLIHGDVVCIYLENANEKVEQSLLSFHYVDINCLSRRGDIGNNGATIGELRVSIPLPETSNSRDEELEQLRRDKAKLIEMLQAQARTIEYQCQRDAESRSRLASLANLHHQPNTQSEQHHERLKEGSPSPSPEIPMNRIENYVPATTPIQISAAARAFYRTSVSPSIQYEQSTDPQRFEDCVKENQTLHKGMLERNATLEELARRLAELEKSTSPQRMGQATLKVPTIPIKMAPRKSMKQYSSESESESDAEVSPSESPVPAVNETKSHNDLTLETEEQKTELLEKNSQLKQGPTADEILRIHRKDPDLEEFGKMHLYVSNSEGVRERYHAAKRERVLCQRIWELEQTLEDLRGEIHIVESNLRIAKDANTEHELRQAQMEDEMTEVSKALLDATDENAVLMRDINALETFLNRTEEALAEASAINEAELEGRIAHMAEEIKALKTVARMWKRRAMQRIAIEFSDNTNNNNGENGDEVINKSGQVPWDELRVESNAARAKKLLGERGCTTAAAAAVDRFEKDTANEAVIALETVLAELENENLRLIDEIKTYEEQLKGYKDLVDRLRQEKDQLEKENNTNKTSTTDETDKFKALYKQKCDELAEAEQQFEAAATKLQTAKQKNTILKKRSVKSNDLLLQEQKRVIEEQLAEQEKLAATLASKDEELRTLLRFLEGRMEEPDVGGFKDDNELRDRIEELLESAMQDCKGTGGYSVFPPDFQFSEEVVALIRVSLRIMMDRLKVELYVLNRQSLHKFGLLVPAVQLRPEPQFHSFMHELRGVVAEIVGKPQRIGGKWALEESDVLSRLVDHRRRRAGNALNGLLIWYDHWDLAPKTEHVSYMELIRNTECVMQLARLVRQESLLNTNATSSLRLMVPGKKGASDTTYIPVNNKDTSITESRRILEKLTVAAKTSNLARMVSSNNGLMRNSTMGFQRSKTTVSGHSTPRKSGISSVTFSRSATFTRKNTTTITNDHNQPREKQQKSPSENEIRGTDNKFGRRATALVVPVSDNDIAFAASTTLARHDSTFNFNRHISALNLPETTDTPKPVTKVARFARAKTDIPSRLTPLVEMQQNKSSNTPTPRRTFNTTLQTSGKSSGLKVNRTITPNTKSTNNNNNTNDTFRRTRTAQFARTNTTGVPLLSSRISGRRPAAAITRTSTGSRPDSPKPSVPLAPTNNNNNNNNNNKNSGGKSFYDPSVLKTLKQRSTSEGNQMPPQTSVKLTKSKVSTGITAPITPTKSGGGGGGGGGGAPPLSPTANFSRTGSSLGCPSSSRVLAVRRTDINNVNNNNNIDNNDTTRKAATSPPPIPRLRLDNLSK